MKYLIVNILCLCLVAFSLKIHQEDNLNYYTNLDAQNWIVTKDTTAYEKNRFVAIIKHPKSIQCPIRKPFTKDGKSCFQCTVQFPIFNLDTNQCQRCPNENKIIDHKCA